MLRTTYQALALFGAPVLIHAVWIARQIWRVIWFVIALGLIVLYLAVFALAAVLHFGGLAVDAIVGAALWWRVRRVLKDDLGSR
jgi:hypothetical protein